MPRCPSCFTPLTRVEQNDIKSAICGNCFGTWINATALLRRARLEAQKFSPTALNEPQADPAPDAPAPVSLLELAEVVQASDSPDMLRCGQCERPMEKGRFHPMIPVQVDRCRRCGYFWLDAGEMALLQRLYSELMTSDDPEIVRRRERLSGTSAHWQGRRSSVDNSQQSGEFLGSSDDGDIFDLLGFLLD